MNNSRQNHPNAHSGPHQQVKIAESTQATRARERRERLTPFKRETALPKQCFFSSASERLRQKRGPKRYACKNIHRLSCKHTRPGLAGPHRFQTYKRDRITTASPLHRLPLSSSRIPVQQQRARSRCCLTESNPLTRVLSRLPHQNSARLGGPTAHHVFHEEAFAYDSPASVLLWSEDPGGYLAKVVRGCRGYHEWSIWVSFVF